MSLYYELEARKYFSDIIENQSRNLSYHDFWNSKDKMLLGITDIIKQWNLQKNNEKSVADELERQKFIDERVEFEKNVRIEIIELLRKNGLPIDSEIETYHAINIIKFMSDEYNIYKESPINYTFYSLEPLKIEKKELIIQINREIKNRVWGSQDEENQEDRQFKCKKNVTNFMLKFDKLRERDVVERIVLKYANSKFMGDGYVNRFNSIDDFFDLNDTYNGTMERSWSNLRHYLRLNDIFSDFEDTINEICEDAELLRRLGYFDENVTPSVSKIEFTFQPKLVGKGTLLGLFVKCLKEGEFKHLPPLKEKDFEEIVKLYNLTAKNVFQNFSANSDKNPFNNPKNLQIIKEILQNLENYPKALYYLENEKHK